MKTSQWPVSMGEDIRLPPKPGIKTRLLNDVCRWCGSVHTSVNAALDCRDLNMGQQK